MQDCHVICISVKLILFLRFPKFCRCHTVNFFENSCKMTLGRKPQQTADLGEILLRFQQQCFCLLHFLLLDKIRQRPACLLLNSVVSPPRLLPQYAAMSAVRMGSAIWLRIYCNTFRTSRDWLPPYCFSFRT